MPRSGSRDPRKTRRRRPAGVLVATGFAIVLPLLAVGSLRHAVSEANGILPELAFSTVVVDRNGDLLRPFQVSDGRWRLETRITDVDPDYLAMLRAYEDRRFADHRGVDPLAIIRAAVTSAISARPVSGGSTLTMQVARLIDGHRTAAPAAKASQIVRALALEQANDKDAILTHYLNRAPFGGNLEGVRTASLAYFGKEPLRLSAAEAALLVALPQSPEARRLDGGPDSQANALAARNRVLDRARDAGVIDERRHARAVAEPLPAGRTPMPLHAPHLTEQLVAAAPYLGRHTVTLDGRLQAELETLARTRGDRLGNGLSVAIMVADHRTGEVLATVGASDYLDRERQGFVDMTRAVRSPGSALKPLIYGLAFHRGLAHPETLIEDREMTFGGYRPENFDGGFRGSVTVREALQLSLNVPAVQMLEAVGPARLLSALRRSGVEPVLAENATANLAMGLGGIGTTLTDLVALQAMVANGGRAVALHTVPGDVEPGPRVLDERAAWQVASILSGVRDPNGITPGAYAFKTGTSYGHRDAWAIGFDGRHTLGVWVGRPSGRPTQTGGRLIGSAARSPVSTWPRRSWTLSSHAWGLWNACPGHRPARGCQRPRRCRRRSGASGQRPGRSRGPRRWPSPTRLTARGSSRCPAIRCRWWWSGARCRLPSSSMAPPRSWIRGAARSTSPWTARDRRTSSSSTRMAAPREPAYSSSPRGPEAKTRSERSIPGLLSQRTIFSEIATNPDRALIHQLCSRDLSPGAIPG